ncbi:MAG: MOSC domain-containing protein [Piscirickettsiaceae bacterium]|nr:MAG: MOSC domain-containing protein [Piscirickettsiaceae bacterium]PCI70293.1 MAG: MOSC domain-containing protein [Piscirickettsiaceae bacterium]
MPTLSKIIVYPIKALAGVELTSVVISKGGTLTNDRRWAMVDRKGRMQNGKNNKKVFTMRPTFNLEEGSVTFAGESTAFELSCNGLLQAYLSEQLGKPVFLKENAIEGFPDDPKAYGPTVVSVASLDAVASWYPNLTLDDMRARFRVNLEIDGVPAFWEDQVFRKDKPNRAINIGEVRIQPTNPCARCSVPIKSPTSGEPYVSFYETFIKCREDSKPTWLDAECFDHWYRLSLNTRIELSEHGGALQLGDEVNIGD